MEAEVKSSKSLYILLIIIISAIIFVIALIILFLLISNPAINLSSTDLQTGKRLELRQSSVVKFSISNEAHELSLDKITGSYVDVTISSTIKTGLKVGETKTFDLTNNNIAEFEIKLISIIAGKATLSFKELTDHAPPCTESWACSSWGPCSNGTQTRFCTDSKSCGTISLKPPITQICCSISCTSWGDCTSLNIKTRNCNWQGNCSISQIPAVNQSCTSSCNCTIYETCINNSCVKKNCSAIGGNLCASDKKCNGTLVNASDTAQCCLNATSFCINKTYADYGYTICGAGTVCSGNNLTFEGTNYCNGSCTSPLCGFTAANKTSTDFLSSLINDNYPQYLSNTPFNCSLDNCPLYFQSHKSWVANFTNITYARFAESSLSKMYYNSLKNATPTEIILSSQNRSGNCLIVLIEPS